MGVVYLAEHPVIGRKVALKAIHPELSRNPEVVSRFVTEAKAVNQIGNEHIVDIHDFGTTPEGEFYFIMEFLQGEALVDRLQREAPMDPARALAIAAQVADALSASHAHGIIHRDLKPENIVLINKGGSADFVKVLDFGLAKLTQGEEKVTHKTRTGSVMGTPYYMSPEQCEGRPNLDFRCDVYSLGVILFEMLTGKVPFGGEGYGEIIVKHITAPLPSARAINPLLSPAHDALLLRALAKNRDERFASMDAFRTAIQDPQNYLSRASVIPTMGPLPGYGQGPAPGSAADAAVSGQVVGGGEQGGSKLASQPTTFREAAGEVADTADQEQIPRSRKGLMLGLLALALAAGGAAAFFAARPGADEQANKQSQPAVAQPAPTPAPVPTPVPTAAPAVAPPASTPPVPSTVTIKFRSEPAGAEVVRKDTGAKMGTTPFEAELLYGKDPVPVVFKKDKFQDRPLSVIPDQGGQVAAELDEVPAPPPAKHPKAGKPAAARHLPRPPKPNGHMDEDGVLAPSF
jgi:tRNA A-37 threonylcarbamoyl transferase component Bud32